MTGKDPTVELQEVLEHYDIGDLTGFELNQRGYVNLSYAIHTIKNGRKDRYFLRKYKKGISTQELEFEHSLINHLSSKGFTQVAKVIPTRSGDSYVIKYEGGQKEIRVFYAIFDLLPGEDKYTWINPKCDQRELISAAQVLARFHQAGKDLKPAGKRTEPKIVDLLPLIASTLRDYPNKTKNTTFDQHLLGNLDSIEGNLAKTRRLLTRPVYRQLLQIPIHCDYHPGNLKFQGGEVVGLFDFDWSKIDVRGFDVALAIFYFFTSWEREDEGRLRLDQMALFLRTYQQTQSDLSGGIPLDSLELDFIPTLINASNLYVLNWTIQDYLNKEVDPQEYLMYLRHAVNFIKWFDDPNEYANVQDTIKRI
jgi:homoserine kinase type II